MNIEFHDREERNNPLSGQSFSSTDEVAALMDKLRTKPPFFCELIGDNGYNLMIGIGGDVGCVQYSARDGLPPYLMATAFSGNKSEGEYMEFLTGGTLTPVERRYCMPFNIVSEIVADFVRSGLASSAVEWEEI
ncbi:MAG: hypothetical protein COA78_37200 [Blastopirellula sp.]|nr:MAG: hypothetical protein COA78_37200 [Blastopirellula sp.]